MDFKVKILYVCLLVVQANSVSRTVTDRSSFVVRRSERDIQRDEAGGKETGPSPLTNIPKLYEMRVDSNITNRFAHTLVTSKVKNFADKAQETVFSIVLPKEAFISKFVMSIGGEDYDAFVKEKEEAKQIYDDAVASGRGAGLVSTSARESNRFTVSVNIEPESKVTFYLSYEQLLEREQNQYELIINIHPKQPVKDLTVFVNIKESQPLKFVRAPPIRTGNEISEVKGDLDPRAYINHIDSNSATVKFNPNLERQKELAKTLGTNVDEGLAGQFVVQYDVERNSRGGEILLNDGYFVHFFAPVDRQPLPKYVVFVLDISGSMFGNKIEQLKLAMKSILKELKRDDKFHLVQFENSARVLDLYNRDVSVRYPSEDPYFGASSDEAGEDINVKRFVSSYPVNPDNIEKAINVVEDMSAGGGTNIADALKVALHLVDVDKRSNIGQNGLQSIIIFLTDGEATIGEIDTNKIINKVTQQNTHSIPIFCLSFGNEADKDLLQKLSLRNNGFSRHIYEAADASLQLQDFYKHISSPVLSNVTFKYVDEAKELSKTTFPILFEGSELVVVGQLDPNKKFDILPKISGHGVEGPIEFRPEVRKPVTRLERLWAYKTIQLLLEDMERSDNKTAYKSRALNLALKYSFVTPVSSLVVVKPNATDSPVEPLPADKEVTIQEDADYDYTEETLARLPFTSQALHLKGSYDSAPASYPIREHQRIRPLSAKYTTPYFPPQVFTTIQTTTLPAPSKAPLTPPSIEELKKDLPWLNFHLKGDTISTTDGTYKLGLNDTSTDNVPCPASPKNGPGLCKLLHECPEVHYLLTNIYIFQQYHCEMRGLAAVCCPHIPEY